MRKSYVVHYEDCRSIGFKSFEHGFLTEAKKQFKKEGKKITKIEYLENGRVVKIKEFW